MRELLTIASIIVGYVVLVRWVLPKLGFPT